jgi:hypothetical protein
MDCWAMCSVSLFYSSWYTCLPLDFQISCNNLLQRTIDAVSKLV